MFEKSDKECMEVIPEMQEQEKERASLVDNYVKKCNNAQIVRVEESTVVKKVKIPSTSCQSPTSPMRQQIKKFSHQKKSNETADEFEVGSTFAQYDHSDNDQEVEDMIECYAKYTTLQASQEYVHFDDSNSNASILATEGSNCDSMVEELSESTFLSIEYNNDASNSKKQLLGSAKFEVDSATKIDDDELSFSSHEQQNATQSFCLNEGFSSDDLQN